MGTTLRVVLVVLLVAGTGLGLAAAFADGAWRDLWLNLLAETFGAALIVFVVDRIFERSKRHDADERRRAALTDLGPVLRELRVWLVRLSQHSDSTGQGGDAGDPERAPFETLLDGFPGRFGTIDFVAPGLYGRDRYFVEWARRTFDTIALELARWERNFAGSEGIFDDAFRAGAERLHGFVRGIGSFLEGMEHYVVREQPAGPVRAYDGVTELTEEAAGRLVSELRGFLAFYRDECRRYELSDPDSGGIAGTRAGASSTISGS